MQKIAKTKFAEKSKDNKPIKINEEENESSDTDEEADKNSKKKKTKKNEPLKMLGKKTKRETEVKSENEDSEEDKEKIDFVGKDEEDSDAESEFDIDEKAEIRAIAKKMLRKKDRLNILDNTYNRYAYDDSERVPEWFMDEEKKHNRPNLPVSKDEINTQKEKLREYNSRMPKKILEAKSRKRNKLTKRLEKVKKKAQAISNQDDINEFSKVKQIEKIYRK